MWNVKEKTLTTKNLQGVERREGKPVTGSLDFPLY